MSGISQQSIIEETKDFYLLCDPGFEYFKKDLIKLKNEFSKAGHELHSARNVLKKFTSEDFPKLRGSIVVKSFKAPNLVNRLVYTFFRKSKAKRSFENSQIVLDAGFLVPKPLAYVEYREGGLLKESFFVSEHLEFDGTLSQVKKQKIFEWNAVLPLVVEQSYRLCQKNILHKDFSPGNILVKRVNDEYQFYLVDLNRLQYGKISKKQSLLNLLRLTHDENSAGIIVDSFSRVSGMDFSIVEKTFRKAIARRDIRARIKKKIKSF